MRRFAITVAMGLLLIAAPCGLFAQTQADMAGDACNGLKKADKQLNGVYRRILK